MDSKIKEILDRIMNTAETVYETAGSVAKETGKKLSEKKDLVKCKTRIMRLRDEMEESFVEIGRLIYESKDGNVSDTEKCESTLAELFDEIDGIKAEINELKLAIEKLSSEHKCEGCGRMNPKDFMYCPECGMKQPEQENDYTDINEEPADIQDEDTEIIKSDADEETDEN